MIRAAATSILVVGVCTALATAPGCLGQQVPRRTSFVLSPQRSGDAVSGLNGAIRVEHTRVAAVFERKGFVYRTGESTYVSDFYHEFYAPPGILLRGVLLEWLREASLFEAVLDAASPAGADWLLESRVEKLYADLREPDALAVLEIEFTLLRARSPSVEAVFQKRFGAAVKAASDRPDAIAQAWSEAASRIFTELEGDLRHALGDSASP